VNQTDAWRFNRGSLLNAGSLVSEAFGCDYIALHDVDLLPNQPELNYHYPALGPYHVSAPGLHPKYKFSKFLGGILVMTRDHYVDVNGFSNMVCAIPGCR
jgi:xylosylprotein 4-beta-galactosyltransferase